MKAYKVTISNEASNYTSTKYNNTLNGFTSEEAASKAAKQALRDAAGEMNKGAKVFYSETLNAWVLANNGNWLLVAKIEATETEQHETKRLTVKRSDWNETAKRLECAGWHYIGTPTATGKTIYRRDNSELEIIIEEEPTTNTPSTMNANETTEFSELTHAGQCLDIYLHNTAEIYERYTIPAINAVVEAVRRNGWQLPKDEAIKNLTFWTSWQDGTKKALQAAARLVKKHDHMTPTAKDIKQVTRNYAAYIVDCAKYEIENAK